MRSIKQIPHIDWDQTSIFSYKCIKKGSNGIGADLIIAQNAISMIVLFTAGDHHYKLTVA